MKQRKKSSTILKVVESYNRNKNSPSKIGAGKKLMDLDFETTQIINNNPLVVKSQRQDRMATEPKDRNVIDIITKEMINANLKKKLQTQPGQKSIKLNFRVANSNSKDKFKKSSKKQNFQQIIKKQTSEINLGPNFCQNCTNLKNIESLMQNQLKKILTIQSMWRSGKINAQQAANGILDFKQLNLLSRSGRITCWKDNTSIIQALKTKVSQLIKDVDCLSEIDSKTVEELKNYQQVKEDLLVEDKTNDIFQLKSWLEELREEYEGTIKYSEEYHQNQLLRMYQRKIRRLGCKLKYYLKQNILLHIEQSYKIKNEQIKKIVDQVLSYYKSSSQK